MNFNLPHKKNSKKKISKNHPVKVVDVEQTKLQVALQKAKENEKNWYRRSDDEEDVMLDYLS